jgi:hypothetical protein
MADEISEEAAARLKDSIAQRQQSIGLITKENEQLEEGLKKQESLLEVEKEKIELLKLQVRLGEAKQDDLDEQIAKVRELGKQLDAVGEASKAGRGFIVDIGNKLGIATKEGSGLLGSLLKVRREGGSIGTVFQEMGKQLKVTFGFANILRASMAKVAESTIAFAGAIDQSRASFTAQTGIVGQLRTQYVGLTQDNLALGFTLERAAESQMALTEGFAGFITLGPDAQNALTSQSVLMGRLGVDTNTTAETINQLTMSFGMSTQEAMTTQREIVGLGTALGMSAQTVSREFTAALPRLALYGDRAIEVFEGMVIAARETGVSVGELNQIFGSAMDTFEGTSRIAGRLNQVLGTDLVSGTELLMAKEGERVNILRERLQLAGMDFTNMGRFQRIAVANAAGITDMTVAARLFGSAQNDIAMQLGDVGLTSTELEERAGKAMSVMEKFKQIFFSIAIAAEPLADFMARIVDSVLDMTQTFPGGGAGMLALATAVGGIGVAGLTALAAPLLAAAVPAAAAAGAAGAAGFGAAGGTAAALGGGALVAAGGTALAAGAAGAMGGGTRQPIVVKVVLNEREMGEAVAEIVDGRVLDSSPRS